MGRLVKSWRSSDEGRSLVPRVPGALHEPPRCCWRWTKRRRPGEIPEGMIRRGSDALASCRSAKGVFSYGFLGAAGRSRMAPEGCRSANGAPDGGPCDGGTR